MGSPIWDKSISKGNFTPWYLGSCPKAKGFESEVLFLVFELKIKLPVFDSEFLALISQLIFTAFFPS